MSASTKETRDFGDGPVTLTKRVWALLEDAYAEAGISLRKLVVNKGSWEPANSLSGTTHAGGGAFDLRLWNIPKEFWEPLTIALRKRNVCGWRRDEKHGGFDLHWHGIVRDEKGLSPGAQWQVDEYDRTNNGLSDRGPDYHPRPKQKPFIYGKDDPIVTPPAKPEPGNPFIDLEEDEMYIFKTHQNDAKPGDMSTTGPHFVVSGTVAYQCGGGYKPSSNVPSIQSPSEEMDAAFFASMTTVNRLK